MQPRQVSPKGLQAAPAKRDLFDRLLRELRGDRDEETFLRDAERIGPYLTCLRGRRFEQENVDWCRLAAAALRARTRTDANPNP